MSDGEQIGSTLDDAALGADGIVDEVVDPETLDRVLRDASSHSRLRGGPTPEDTPMARLQREVGLWRSPKMQAVWEILQRAAGADVTVLISGETGTGKDLAARAIHYVSVRRRAPFVAVNCAAVPRDLLESELFGHERGAFTGAHQLKTGKFESANHGTIFLDEIGDLDPALQAKLLHVLQDGAFSRVGGRSTIKVDVRVLAATNRDLGRAAMAGRFRDDLYYRLNVISVVVPPLRERREEIPLLVSYFVERYATRYHREGFQVTPEAMDRLMVHAYPGNVRELENVVKRMIVLSDPNLTETSFPSDAVSNGRSGPVETTDTSAVFLKDIVRRAVETAEQEAIGKMLEHTGWNRVRTAKLLNISYRALLYKMKRSELQRAALPASSTF